MRVFNKHELYELLVFNITTLIIMLLSIIAVIISEKQFVDSYNTAFVAQSAFKILKHNLMFLFMYAIPLMGLLHFMISFAYSAFIMGLSMNTNGLVFTLIRLIHLPLELCAFSIPLVYANRRFWQTKPSPEGVYWKQMLLALLLLCLSALLESRLK